MTTSHQTRLLSEEDHGDVKADSWSAPELEVMTQALLDVELELEPNQNLEHQYTPGFFPVDGLKVKVV